MTPLELLLTGTCLILLGMVLTFGWLWWKGIDRRYAAEQQRDNLRAILKDAAHQRSNVVVLADEQRMTRALAEADHHDMQRWK